MALEALSKVVLKRAKVVIVVWLIVFVLAVPTARDFRLAIKYEITEFLPKELEAFKASEINRANYPYTNVTNLVIVVLAENATDRRVYDVILRIEGSIRGLNLSYLSNITSLPSIYEKILEIYWRKMNETYAVIKDYIRNNITDIHEKLYLSMENVTEAHRKFYYLKDMLNNASMFVFGPPYAYAYAWTEAISRYYIPFYPALSIYKLNEEVYRYSWNAIESRIAGSVPEDLISIIHEYHTLIFLLWNSTFKEPYPSPEEVAKIDAYEKMHELMPNAINRTLIKVDPRILIVYESLTLKEWMNETVRENTIFNLAIKIASEGLTEEEKEYLIKIVSLGPNPTPEDFKELVLSIAYRYVPAEYRDRLIEVFNLGPSPTPQDIEELVERYANEVMGRIREKYPTPKYPDAIPRSIYEKLVGKSGKSTVVVVSLNAKRIEHVKESAQAIREAIKKYEAYGVSLYLTGSEVLDIDKEDIISQDVPKIDMVSIILVLVLVSSLLVSLVAPILPLVVIGTAIVIAQAVLYIIYMLTGFTFSFFLRYTLTVTLLGAGIDYAVFILYRFFEERSQGLSVDESTLNSVKYAGEAILFSGATVAAGFLTLTISRIGILQGVGLGLAIGIFITIVLSLTVMPSLLKVLGDKAYWPRRAAYRAGLRVRYLRGASEAAVKRPYLTLLVFILITVVLGYYAMGLTRTFNDIAMMPDVESKRGIEVVLSDLGGEILPSTYLIVKTKEPLIKDSVVNEALYKTLYDLTASLINTEGILKVYGPASPNGTLVPYDRAKVEEIHPYVGKDPSVLKVTVICPYLYFSDEAIELVDKIKSAVRPIAGAGVEDIYVGGFSALLNELSKILDEDYYYKIVPTIIIAIFVLLILLLRVLIAPVMLIITILMSIAWGLGALTLLFQHYLGYGVYWVVPIFLFSVLLGLGMDYNIFLISRVKENIHKGMDYRDAIVTSVERTGLVITACGLIMAAALGSLLISSIITLKEIGFVLMFTILCDACLVMIFLTPSILAILKRLI